MTDIWGIQFWREIWIQVIVILLQLYYDTSGRLVFVCFIEELKTPSEINWSLGMLSEFWLKKQTSAFSTKIPI